ncbi:M56 family metallopeptidase [Thermoflexibacter ruber]|uniref:BlaR1 peptidase M56 n=1 Tax=Thermoflexibacter ruber TaxID=1003 RepID=A0A1I2EL75_9BACT|nr:M56 family metallopeptidase [Thermoflexibacter ruber]SFE93529.1 BlaR1 peptidase M56 [Thermoflexibacter ruber]
MTYFIYHFLSVLVFFAFYQVFLKKDTFFERNRWYLLTSLAVALLAPFLDIPLSRQRATEIGEMQVFVLPEITVEQTETQSWSWGEIVGRIYWLGVGIALIMFLIRIFKLIKMIKENELENRFHNYSNIRVRNSHSSTFSFFNYLFWDSSQNLTKQEEKQILEHELAHIRGGHSYDLIFIALQKVIFWFNPLIYLYEKEIVNQHEFIADRKAKTISNTEDYVSLMVSSLFKNLQLDFIHSFHNQQIKQRIKMLHAQKTTKLKGNAKTVLAIALVATTALLVACSKQILPEIDKATIAYQNGKDVYFYQSEKDFVKQLSPIITRHAKNASMELDENSMAERKIVSYKDGKSVLYTAIKDKNNRLISIATPLEKDGKTFKISSTESSISCEGSCGCVVEYHPPQNNKPAYYACSCSPCKMRVE